VEKLERAQTRILHDIARIGLVAGKPAREVIGRIQVRQNGLFKSCGLMVQRRVGL
jgi:hypothetical protein